MAEQTKPVQQGAKANTPAAPAKPAAAAAAPATGKVKSKRERFEEIVPKRMRDILRKLEILGNCSNRSGYEYTQKDIDKMFTAIEDKTKKVRAMFLPKTEADKEEEWKL